MQELQKYMLWSIQGNYGGGFETESSYPYNKRKDALADIKEYRFAQPGVPYRLKKEYDKDAVEYYLADRWQQMGGNFLRSWEWVDGLTEAAVQEKIDLAIPEIKAAIDKIIPGLSLKSSVIVRGGFVAIRVKEWESADGSLDVKAAIGNLHGVAHYYRARNALKVLWEISKMAQKRGPITWWIGNA